jgi:hypothetical protein
MEDHALASVLQLLQMLFCVLDVDNAPEDPQMVYRQRAPVPELKWGPAVDALA